MPAILDREVMLFPAHAGINRNHDGVKETGLPVPRPRGDQPDIVTSWDTGVICSPPTRGSTVAARKPLARVSLFPAHAGINRLRFDRTIWQRAVPRSRGDQPIFDVELVHGWRCSPPTRGSTDTERLIYGEIQLFPADAGVNRLKKSLVSLLVSVPHPRGDQPDWRDDGI